VQNNFSACLNFTLSEEGLLSLDPHDPGNWTSGKPGVGLLNGTNYGISAAAYPYLDIKSLTKIQASAIYERDYWTPSHCPDLPLGVDCVVFDTAVNAGPGRAAKLLQAAVGVVADGDIGPVTLYAVGKMAPADLIGAFTKFRIGFYNTMADAALYAGPLVARARRCQAAAMGMDGAD
jgi:lysozyme family protein